MEQEVFLAEYGPNFVGFGLADAADALADDGVSRGAGRQISSDGLVDAGVKEQPPVLEQRRLGRQPPQLARVRDGKQQQRFRQFAVRFEAEVGPVGDGQQRLAADDVALAVRHLQAGAGQSAVLLDDAAQDARRHEQRGRVGGGQLPFQVGQGEHGDGHAVGLPRGNASHAIVMRAGAGRHHFAATGRAAVASLHH